MGIENNEPNYTGMSLTLLCTYWTGANGLQITELLQKYETHDCLKKSKGARVILLLHAPLSIYEEHLTIRASDWPSYGGTPLKSCVLNNWPRLFRHNDVVLLDGKKEFRMFRFFACKFDSTSCHDMACGKSSSRFSPQNMLGNQLPFHDLWVQKM